MFNKLMKRMDGKQPSHRKMLEKEAIRCLAKMNVSEVESEEYSRALVRYKAISEELIKYEQIKESKAQRITEVLGTFGFMTVTLTAEQWTPLTSKWWHSLCHPIRTRRSKNN